MSVLYSTQTMKDKEALLPCIPFSLDMYDHSRLSSERELILPKGNIATGTDPNKENMIRFQRHKSMSLDTGNLLTRKFLERNAWPRILLSGMAMFGVSLIMSDGILT